MLVVLFNDASLEGRFASPAEFKASFREVMSIQRALKKWGAHLSVCKTLRYRQVTPDMTLQKWVGSLPLDQQTEAYLWISNGPFWDKPARHPEEYFTWECDGENTLVTYTALAEATYLFHEGRNVWLVTITPSRFAVCPLVILWEKENERGNLRFEMPNFWSSTILEKALEYLPQEVESWDGLLLWINRHCPYLLVSSEIKAQLGAQFFPNVANRCQVLLQALNEIAEAVTKDDEQKYLGLRATWMEGEMARITDSSEREKNEFTPEMTFMHTETGENIVCHWHGKIKTPQYRIHFEWPMPQTAKKMFVGYIGPKITKR